MLTSPFADLGLASPLVAALLELGYEEPTPIQREAIPPLLKGRDLLGQAATGTGKTAAFALPLLQRLPDGEPEPGRPAVLVLVPTRELAMQVAEAFHRYGRSIGAGVVPIYGGQEFSRQIRALKQGVHVVVATPGRALDHLRRGTLDLSAACAVALDEADEMLDMGFADDLEAILSAAPPGRQTALFSATMPPKIAALAEAHLRNPVRVTIAREPTAAGKLPRVRQTAYVVPRAHKVAALARVLDLEAPALALVFCRTRTEVDTLTETLAGRGWRAEALHGGMSQEQRDRVMKRTRAGNIELLVATDVAARGLDIEQVSHVVNFDVPSSPAAYVHRIGRTGRAGREGVAITLAEPREHRYLRNIEQVTKQRIAVERVPTVMDVQAKRLELTRASLREALLGDGLERFRVVVESLADEFDPMEIASAAVRLAHEAAVGDNEDGADDEIPDLRREAGERVDRETPRPMRDGKRSRAERPERGERGARDDRSERRERPERGGGERGPAPKRSRGPAGGMARIYIGAGRTQKVRPTDLVGAIVNEASLPAQQIGAIEITDRFSLVELPVEAVDAVVKALRATTIKGKKLTVRRDLANRGR